MSSTAGRPVAGFSLHAAHGLESYPLGRTTLVGRDPGCDITLPDAGISRRHAMLTVVGDTLWVEDMASTNGTFLNGTRLIQGAYARAGDELRFDTRAFRLQGSPVDANKTLLRPALKQDQLPPATPARAPTRPAPERVTSMPVSASQFDREREPVLWYFPLAGFVLVLVVLAVYLVFFR